MVYVQAVGNKTNMTSQAAISIVVDFSGMQNDTVNTKQYGWRHVRSIFHSLFMLGADFVTWFFDSTQMTSQIDRDRTKNVYALTWFWSLSEGKSWNKVGDVSILWSADQISKSFDTRTGSTMHD